MKFHAPESVEWKRLLFVDGRGDRAEKLRSLLRGETGPLVHLQVVEVERAARALAEAAFDCALVDCGFEDAPLVLSRLASGENGLPELPVVFLVRGGAAGDVSRAFRAGADDVLLDEELSSAAIFRAVEGAATRHGLRRELSEQRPVANRRDAPWKELGPRLRMIGELIPHLVWFAGADGEPQYINRRMERYVGTTADGFRGEAWLDWIHPEDASRARDAWTAAVRTGGDYVCEYRMRRAADGAYEWHVASARPLRDDASRLLGWFGTTTNIHRVQQTEEALRERERLLRLATEAAGVGIWSIALEEDDFYWSPETYEIMGIPAEAEITSERMRELIHPEDREAVDEANRRALDPQSGGVVEAEHRIVRPGGEVRWVYSRGEVIFETRGERPRPVRALGIVVDVTRRKRSEVDLRQARDRFHGLIEQASDAIFVANLEGIYTEVNSAACELLGYEREELLGKRIADILAPEEFPRLEAAREWLLETGGTQTAEWTLLRVDGSRVETEISAKILRGGDWQAIVRDISPRRREQQALRESQERLRSAMDAAELGHWRVDLRTNLATRSANLNRILGLPVEETTQPAEDYFSRVHPADRAHVEPAWREAVAGRGPYDVENRVLRPDGDIRWIRDRGRVVAGPDGEPTHVTGAMADITDRKRAEEALRASERRFRGTFENAGVGVAHVAADGSWQWVNQTLCDILGYTREELYEKRFRDVTHPDHLEGDLERFRRLMSGEIDSYAVRKRYVRKDGSPVWCYLSTAAERDADGRSAYSISIIQDIDAQVSAEEELKRLNDNLEERVAQRTAELDVRNEQLRLLATKLSAAEHRERRRIAHLLHENLQQILVAGKMQLALARARAGGRAAAAALDSAQDLLEESIEVSRNLAVELCPPTLYDLGLSAGLEWLADRVRELHRLPVELHLDPGAEPSSLDVQVFLFQAVQEMLLNVVKHAGADRARVALGRDDGDRCRISVEDDGCGCDPADISQHPYPRDRFGLFNIQQRLELLGGDFVFDSMPGSGCRVVLTLDRDTPSEEALSDEDDTLAVVEVGATSGEPAPAGEGPSIRLLLADDHKLVRDGLVSILESEPQIELVAQAADGQEAVELALERRPDVILMDVSMPRLDGIEAARRIMQGLPETRIIGLSVHSEDDMQQRMLDAGAVAYLTKSRAADELLSAIRSVCAMAPGG